MTDQAEVLEGHDVVRISPASYGIVKITRAGVPQYLLQRNKHRGTFNFISGHVENEIDEGYFARAMDREQVEELEAAGFSASEMAYVALPKPLLQVDRGSDRYPGQTRYIFKLYQLFFSGNADEVFERATRDPENVWFSVEELRSGRSSSGCEVSNFPVSQLLELLGDGLDELPESCPVPENAVRCRPLTS
jgi:hypothetical protein